MIRRKNDNIYFWEKLVDQLIVYASWMAAYVVRFHYLDDGQPGLLSWYVQYGFLLVLLSIYFFKNSKVYVVENIYFVSKRISAQLKANSLSLLVFVVFAFFLSDHRVSRVMLVTYFAISTTLLLMSKMFFRNIFMKKMTRVVLLGDGNSARAYREKVEELSNIEIVGTDEQSIQASPDVIVIGFDNIDYEKVEGLIAKYKEEIIPIIVLPDIQNSILGFDIQSFQGIPMIVYNEPKFKSSNMFVKRSFDFISCGLGLLIISPLLILIAVLVKITSKGPIFHGQVRMGLDGKEFKMWKFRSMVTDASNHGGWTVANDPRITPIGRFLRKTSMDELPQLWNVVVGQMSLVGPRPERPQFVNEFKKDIPAYMLRHKMKAGITGWAQINGWRGDTSIEKRIECDIWYIKNWSLWLDISIVFLTFWKGFINKNAY